MNKYVDSLDLEFDPFETDAGLSHFYVGGNRDYLLDQLIQQSYYGGAITVVTAALGSGKSTLAHWFQQSLDEDANSVLISASLFMTRSQLLESICEQLGVDCSDPLSDGELMAAIASACAELNSQSRYLQLILDDAHELGRDVIQVVTDLYLNKAIDKVHVLLLGEKQLNDMLDSLLPVNSLEEYLVRYEFDEFIAEEVAEYLTFKLSAAGYGSELPFDPADLTTIHSRSNGIPGAINMLAIAQLNRQFGAEASASSVADFSSSTHQVTSKPVMMLPPMAKYLAAAGFLGLALFFAVSFTGGNDESGVPSRPLADAGNISGRVQIPVGPAANVFPAGPAVQLGVRELAGENYNVANSRVEDGLTDLGDVERSLADLEQPIPLLPGQLEDGDMPSAAIDQADSDVPAAIVQSTTTIAEPIPVLAQAEATATAATAPDSVPEALQPVREQIVEPESARPALEVNAEPEGYAERILAYQAQHYTLQLLGTYSKASAQKFIEENSDADRYAYFETRFQDRPWFVVVYGSFPDRSAATAAIASLPAAQRALEPWARSLGGIQEDIRKYWVQAN